MARITATNLFLQGEKQTAEELAPLLNCSAEWIRQNVGVNTRYVAPAGTDPAILAAEAVRPLIEQNGAPDQLIYASASVRQFLPDTSVFVAQELGLDGVPCYSVHASCLSFLVALQQASLLIDGGYAQKVAIVSCELATQSRDFNHPESAALFGDGAAAALLEASESHTGLSHFAQRTWPAFAELSELPGGGLLRHPENPTTQPTDYLFHMDGEQLLRATLPRLRTFLNEFFNDANFEVEELDWVIPHQASAAGLKILDHLGMPKDKVVNVLGEYGNCVSASIPMALRVAHRDGLLKQGDRVLLLGSAAGLSLGAALWTW